MNTILKIVCFCILSLIMYGCHNSNVIIPDNLLVLDCGGADDAVLQEFSRTNTNHTTRIALICNLVEVDRDSYDGWDGYCPGTDVDADNFAKMCSKNGIPYIKLEDEECTIQRVITSFRYAAAHLNPTNDNNLIIWYYSGHGGQVYNPQEKDYLDETLCLWDGQLRDDVVWKLFQELKKNTRIWYVTDCCNSGSNFQMPYNFSRSKPKMFARGSEPRMIHYGGCNDGESSYGSGRGGVFTNILRDNYNEDLSYIEWFKKSKEKTSKTGQVPTYFETGATFKNMKIFK